MNEENVGKLAGEEDIEKRAGDEEAGKKPSVGVKLFGGGKKKAPKSGAGRKRSEDDIKRLTRTELLELLIDETKEADRLRAENARLTEELERCHADIDRVASFEAVIARLERIVNGR